MANQKVSQLTPITSSSDNDLFYVSRSLTDKSIRYADLKNSISSYIYSWTDATITANSTQNINLGLSASYRSFKITYSAERGTRFITGEIWAVHDGTNVGFDYNITMISGDDIGFTVDSAQISASQVQLTLGADNSDGTDISFKYSVVQIAVA